MICLLVIDSETVNDAIENMEPDGLLNNNDMQKFLKYLDNVDWDMADEYERIYDEIRAHYLTFKKES